MGGASKILMLLSTPFPLLYPRPSSAVLRLARRSRAAALSSLSSSHPFSNSTPTPLHPKSPFKSQLHSQSAAQREPYADSSLPSSAPISRGSAAPGGLWPEWARLAENLTAGGYSGRGAVDDDEFVVLGRMPEEFARAAEACLAFARDRPDALRLLGKKNIEVIVNSGSPSLFKNGASSARRMRLFLSGDESNVSRQLLRGSIPEVITEAVEATTDVSLPRESSKRPPSLTPVIEAAKISGTKEGLVAEQIVSTPVATTISGTITSCSVMHVAGFPVLSPEAR